MMPEPTAIIRRSLAGSFREPEGLLRHPYVDPGGVYGKNLWDWDAFWCLKTALHMAAAETAGAPWRAQVARHAAGVLDNFFEHQGADGSLPILMSPDDCDWFLSTTDPAHNMAKPIFGQLMAAWYDLTGDHRPVASWCAALGAFYDCYWQRALAPCGLLVWANDVAIGCDDDPATWGRPPRSSANLLLNNLMYADLRAAAPVAAAVGLTAQAAAWHERARALGDAIQQACWDERDGFFYSVDVQSRQRLRPHHRFGTLNQNLVPSWSSLPFKLLYWTGFLPLWNGLATPAQAQRMVQEHLLRPDRFWAAAGVRTLSADERMYDPESSRGNPSNWLGPVWILSNCLVWEGLRRYGFHAAARTLAARTLDLLARDYQAHGHWHENYHPDCGQGLAAPGFVSWNALVHFMANAEQEPEE